MLAMVVFVFGLQWACHISYRGELSQQASGVCAGTQLPPDSLVLTITNVVIQLQLVNIRQHNSVMPHRA